MFKDFSDGFLEVFSAINWRGIIKPLGSIIAVGLSLFFLSFCLTTGLWLMFKISQ